MTGDKDDQGQPEETPWHHSTPAVLGASVAALVAIGLVVWAAIGLTSSADRPEDAPIDFVPPSSVTTSVKTSTTTTTQTITPTRPPETTEFGLPGVSDTSGTSTTSGTETSGSSETTTTTTTSVPTSTVPPHTRTSPADGGEYPTTRNRPRTNVTRTLYPAPVG